MSYICPPDFLVYTRVPEQWFLPVVQGFNVWYTLCGSHELNYMKYEIHMKYIVGLTWLRTADCSYTVRAGFDGFGRLGFQDTAFQMLNWCRKCLRRHQFSWETCILLISMTIKPVSQFFQEGWWQPSCISRYSFSNVRLMPEMHSVTSN